MQSDQVRHTAGVLQIAAVLGTDDLERIRRTLADAPFQDGKVTAGATAREVKSNLQADGRDAEVRDAAALVRRALESNDVFRAYARPVRWSRLIFSRYRPGHSYGTHVDDALMTGDEGVRFRSDLSFTLFLSDPASYTGGELSLDTRTGARQVKLRPGAMVLYASGSLHRVEPVTHGERLACVGWVQSAVRRDDERELLFDVSRVRSSLPPGDPRLLLDKVASNLMRMWADT